MQEYAQVIDQLNSGWNTWSTWSMFTQVRQPSGAAVNICFKNLNTGTFLRRCLMGSESVIPEARSFDGSYNGAVLELDGFRITVRSGTEGDDLVLKIACDEPGSEAVTVFLEFSFLWNSSGSYSLRDGAVCCVSPREEIFFYPAGRDAEDLNVPCTSPFFSFSLLAPVILSSGRVRSEEEVDRILKRNRERLEKQTAGYGSLAECYRGLTTVMAWDTIWEPSKRRVISPVSRYWNADLHGGWVLFVWDTYFAGTLASVFSRELAYTNTVEITKEILPEGYIGIMNCPLNMGTDRSQPPVGSFSALGLYNRFGERWFLEEIFDDLFRWNSWWPENRSVGEGLLAWGYNRDATSENFMLESGLDNSPLYDDVYFNEETLTMDFADVGLISLYAADCRALESIAAILGREEEGLILAERAARYEGGLNTLWDEEAGIYKNRDLVSGEFSSRLAPTLFYPLLTKAPTGTQARRMVHEHLLNPEEFFGEWMIPSIARNDPAYGDQDYWRGRIWGPMNWLVYLGLKKCGFFREASWLAEKSKALFLKEWNEKGHVHENYNAQTGTGCPDGKNSNGSDPFYHWGALLALIPLVEEGYVEFDPWSEKAVNSNVDGSEAGKGGGEQ